MTAETTAEMTAEMTAETTAETSDETTDQTTAQQAKPLSTKGDGSPSSNYLFIDLPIVLSIFLTS